MMIEAFEARADFGQIEEAVQAYQQAIALDPNYAEAHGNLGISLASLGRLEQAVAAFGEGP